ncbi:RNA-directed RNA polymerase [Bienertia sinuspersici]
MKDSPLSISQVSYPKRVAPLPEDRVSVVDERKERVELEIETRNIEANNMAIRRVFKVVEEEKEVPFPKFIKVEEKKNSDRKVFDLQEAIRQVKEMKTISFDGMKKMIKRQLALVLVQLFNAIFTLTVCTIATVCTTVAALSLQSKKTMIMVSSKVTRFAVPTHDDQIVRTRIRCNRVLVQLGSRLRSMKVATNLYLPSIEKVT